MTEVEFDEEKKLEEVRARKQELASQQKPQELSIQSFVGNEISAQYEKDKQELANNEEFKKSSREITERATKAQFDKDRLDILKQEHLNELSAYVLACEKEKLKFRQEKEKKLIIEDVKADLANKKIATLKKRYGYLYKDGEEFIPSKSYNRQREIANWWSGTSETFRKVVKSTAKAIGICALVFALGFVGYKAIQWLLYNAQYIPNLGQ
ncbi:MAG: hypothetical protein IJ371_02855 [Clostridia bacterium]|nr:hypothetical protein [Clostridia bacterium]